MFKKYTSHINNTINYKIVANRGSVNKHELNISSYLTNILSLCGPFSNPNLLIRLFMFLALVSSCIGDSWVDFNTSDGNLYVNDGRSTSFPNLSFNGTGTICANLYLNKSSDTDRWLFSHKNPEIPTLKSEGVLINKMTLNGDELYTVQRPYYPLTRAQTVTPYFSITLETNPSHPDFTGMADVHISMISSVGADDHVNETGSFDGGERDAYHLGSLTLLGMRSRVDSLAVNATAISSNGAEGTWTGDYLSSSKKTGAKIPPGGNSVLLSVGDKDCTEGRLLLVGTKSPMIGKHCVTVNSLKTTRTKKQCKETPPSAPAEEITTTSWLILTLGSCGLAIFLQSGLIPRGYLRRVNRVNPEYLDV